MSIQGLHQVQKQTQTLVLAPQLRQSLKILQVPALELRNVILEELQTNPALEEQPLEGISLEQKRSDGEDDSGSDNNESAEMDFGDDFSILQKLDEDWREHFAQESRSNVYTTEDAERRQHFFDSLTSEESLQEHLMRQAEMSDAGKEELAAIEFLIGSLDDRGFITSTLADIALLSRLPIQTVTRAHVILKGLDPVGIGSIDLQDCLLFQLNQSGKGKSLAADIIRDHFKLLLRRRIPELSRKLGVSVDEIHKALEMIALLDPAPGRRFSDDNNRIIVPDVRVEKDGQDWLIHLNNDYIPSLRLSRTYKEMIAKGRLNSKEKEYIRDKLRSGKFLISSIEQRQQTIERITREILKFQEDFFEQGKSKLRPLTMSQVADEVGVHETTVSRAIANKYIDTPHGIFDFKYFFTTGYQSDDGKSLSNTSVKGMIVKLVDEENPAKPLSDQKIVTELANQNIKIARRTVAKYREELGILPTNLRRRYE